MIKSAFLKVAVVAVSLGLMAGCATNSQMQEDIARAQATADAAQATADRCNERCGRMVEKTMAK